MKKQIVIGTLCVMPLCAFHNVRQTFDDMDRQMDEMHQQMQQVFAEMSERTHHNKIEAPDYQLQMQEKDDAIVLTMELPKNVKSEQVSVALENDMLDVLVEHEGKIELKISSQMVTMSASKLIKHEQKDAQGKTHVVSAGSSHMAQTLSLPARVDFQRVAPQADLTDGLLTVTLAKKGGAQKIQVTSAGTQALAPVNEQKDLDK